MIKDTPEKNDYKQCFGCFSDYSTFQCLHNSSCPAVSVVIRLHVSFLCCTVGKWIITISWIASIVLKHGHSLPFSLSLSLSFSHSYTCTNTHSSYCFGVANVTHQWAVSSIMLYFISRSQTILCSFLSPESFDTHTHTHTLAFTIASIVLLGLICSVEMCSVQCDI